MKKLLTILFLLPFIAWGQLRVNDRGVTVKADSMNVSRDIVVGGTVDGRDISKDGDTIDYILSNFLQSIPATYVQQSELGDSAAQLRSEIPDVSPFATKVQLGDTAAQLRTEIPTNNNQLINGAGYITGFTETDPIYSAWDKSTGIAIATSQISDWATATASFLTGETDPIYSASQAANITAGDITNLGNLSGTNTGDQDLSSLATKTALNDTAAQLRTEIPTNNNQLTNGAGYITGYTESDPVYSAWDKSTGINITASQITDWATATASFLTGESDPVYSAWDKSTGIAITASQVTDFDTEVTNNSSVVGNTGKDTTGIYHINRALLDAITPSDTSRWGSGTGVDLTPYVQRPELGDTAAQLRTEIPTNNNQLTNGAGYITGYTETDPVYSASQASNITAGDITNLGNLSGTNTGDQDLSSYATKTQLGDSTAQLRSEIPTNNNQLTNGAGYTSYTDHHDSTKVLTVGTDTLDWSTGADAILSSLSSNSTLSIQNIADAKGGSITIIRNGSSTPTFTDNYYSDDGTTLLSKLIYTDLQTVSDSTNKATIIVYKRKAGYIELTYGVQKH